MLWYLKSLSYIPKKLQFAVAMMSLERNWRIDDIRAEAKRIKEGKGLRPIGDDSLEEPPSSNPTLIQRHLHPNIDRFLSPNEEKFVRAVKRLGEATNKQLIAAVGVSLSPLTKIALALSEMNVLDVRTEQRGKGRPTKIYRRWKAEEQPKSARATG